MKLLSMLSRLCALATLLAVAGWVALPLASREQPSPKRFDQRKKTGLAERSKAFSYLPVASARKGNVVEVTLTVAFAEHDIDRDAIGMAKDRIRTRSYNGKLCGPVIRVKPGDLLKIRLKNDTKKSDPDTPYDPKNPNAPHGFNVTNLHTHGLNVSPSGRSDNVFLEVGPEEQLDLCFDIPKDHPAGTFWYHAHKHGSVALQLAGGMAGVLIVDGGEGSLDAVPEVAAASTKEHEKILVFQQIPYRPSPGKVVEISAEDVYATPQEKTALAKDDTLVRNTLINGELFPTLSMKPGEVQRWRCVHAGLESSLDLVLVEETKDAEKMADRVKLNEIAVDGLPLGTLEEWTHVELQPGYRSDLLVKAPPEGTYLLQTLSVPPARSITGSRQNPRYLARVVVKGPALEPEMKLPQPASLKPYRLPSVKDTVKREESIRFFSYDQDKEFLVNDKAFSKDDVLLRAKLGAKEEWTLSSEGGRHPFHIHVNPFEVLRKNENGVESRVWRDTVLVVPGEISIWTEFRKFPGKTVLHCHNLRHEDQGMMAALEIEGKAPVSRCPEPSAGLKRIPVECPKLELPDARGTGRKLADYKGKKVLLVFSRGWECAHCRTQLKALTTKAKAIESAELMVIAVCPVSSERLAAENASSVLLLADPKGTAFRAFGCHDGRALHGTFLIDSKGVIQWQDAGDEPYLDVDAILKRAKEMK